MKKNISSIFRVKEEVNEVAVQKQTAVKQKYEYMKLTNKML
jgi:hypothetical protein